MYLCICMDVNIHTVFFWKVACKRGSSETFRTPRDKHICIYMNKYKCKYTFPLDSSQTFYTPKDRHICIFMYKCKYMNMYKCKYVYSFLFDSSV
jgi:hypothetical protein